MKIVFKNKKEKEIITNRFANVSICPSVMDLKEDCTKECEECWENALEEMEVEE